MIESLIVLTMFVLFFILPMDIYYFVKLRKKEPSCEAEVKENKMNKRMLIFVNIFGLLVLISGLLVIFLL